MDDLEKRRILVVDDDEEVLRWFKRAAEAAGYEVVQAVSGAVGLDLAGRDRFDLILLDISLPAMDGRDVLRRLKMNPRTGDVPVLVHSGSTNLYDRRIVLELGAEDFAEKPVDPSSLIQQIGSLIRKARHRAPQRQ